jgi:hypothetical protein
MSEQHSQELFDKLNELGKSAAMACASFAAFINALKLMRSSNRYLQQHYKNSMRPGYHLQMPLPKEKRIIIRLRTYKHLKAIYRTSERRRNMNKIIYGLKLKREYIIPGRNPNSKPFTNGSTFEIRSK